MPASKPVLMRVSRLYGLANFTWLYRSIRLTGWFEIFCETEVCLKVVERTVKDKNLRRTKYETITSAIAYPVLVEQAKLAFRQSRHLSADTVHISITTCKGSFF
jgi:hypothetical protein